MTFLLLAACVVVPEPVIATAPSAGTPVVTTPSVTTPGATPSGEIPAPAVCEREAGYADFGAPRMRLDVSTFTPGEPLTLTAMGAVPGDVVSFEVGHICALDCPAELDGGCFQPVSALALGVATADAGGTAVLDLAAASAWTGDQDFLVFQAVTRAAAEPYVSQAVVDRAGWNGGFDFFEVAPMTVRGLGGAQLRTTVAAGRRVEVSVGGDMADFSGGWLDVHTESTTARAWNAPGATELDVDAATTFDLFAEYGDFTGSQLDVEIRIRPRTAPIPWVPDGDGDGFGDPAAVPVLSATPIPGHVADLRDCDDTDAAFRPWGLEVCGDGVDQDCDGADRPCHLDPLATTLDAGDSGTVIRGAASSFGGWSVALGDVDSDGDVELVVGGENGYAVDLVGRADVEQAAQQAFRTEQGGLVLGDFDGDGATDVLSGDSSFVYLLAGPLTLPSAAVGVQIPPPGSVYGAGDVDGDGDHEVLMSDNTSPASGIELWEPEDWTLHAALPAGAETGARLADSDGDGLDDLWTGELCVYLAPFPNDVPVGCVDDGPDDFVSWRSAPAIGDVDGDGTLDAAMGDGPEVRIFLGPILGDRSIADATSSTFTSGAHQARIALAGSRMFVASAPEVAFDPAPMWIAPTGPGTHDGADAVAVVAGWFPGAIAVGDGDGDGVEDLFVGWPDHAWGGDANVGLIMAIWGE